MTLTWPVITLLVTLVCTLVVVHSTPSFAVGYVHHGRPKPKAFISRREADAGGPRTLCSSVRDACCDSE